MKVNTRLFGEIEVAEDRIITFTQGLMGFEEYTRYTLIYNSEKKGRIMMTRIRKRKMKRKRHQKLS